MAKSNVVPFRSARKSGSRKDRNRPQGKWPRSGKNGPNTSLTAVILAIIIAAGGRLAFGGAGDLSGVLALSNIPPPDTSAAAVSFCGDSTQMNCVVDGDMFWFKGEKIRIADIDTPELSPPRCEAERIKRRGGESTPAGAAQCRKILAIGRLARRGQIWPQTSYRHARRALTRRQSHH